MRKVKWEDVGGVKHISLIRDTDSDEDASHGLPQDPPGILELDWVAIGVELHNLLVEREIITMQDVLNKPGQLKNAIDLIVGRKIKELYQQGGK